MCLMSAQTQLGEEKMQTPNVTEASKKNFTTRPYRSRSPPHQLACDKDFTSQGPVGEKKSQN